MAKNTNSSCFSCPTECASCSYIPLFGIAC
jgi:hypothetical protein